MKSEFFIYSSHAYGEFTSVVLLKTAADVANFDFATKYIVVTTNDGGAVETITSQAQLEESLVGYPMRDYAKLFADLAVEASFGSPAVPPLAILPSPEIPANADPEPVTKPRKGRAAPKKENATNKTRATKRPLRAVPPIAAFALGYGMEDGAEKYNMFNFRETEVTASIFYEKMKRHLEEWYSGQNFASDSGKHHLAHLMSNAAIILDAELCGVFIDDRSPTPVDFERVLKAPNENKKGPV